MIRIFLSTVLALLVGFMIQSENVEAKSRVAIILDIPNSPVSEPELIHKNLNESIDKIFGQNLRFEVIPIEETSTYVQLYFEENDLLNSFEPALKKANLSELDKHFEADYLVYVRVSNGISKFSSGLFSASQKVNVTTDFRVWSAEKEDYVYIKRYQSTGKSTSVYIGIGSAEHAIEKGLKKALKQIEKDADKIRASMT